jgi:zinc transporter ZupT
MLLPFALAFVLSLLHFFSEEYCGRIERFHTQLISFSAGLFITLIFLDLLPEFFKGITHAGEDVFFAMLLGFILFHLGEKYVYQHITNKRELLSDLKAIHALGFFVDHFTVGVVLYLALSVPDYLLGLVIFVPLLLHTVSSSLSLCHIDEVYSRKSPLGLLLPLSPVFGVAFAFLLSPTKGLYYLLFSFVIGSLFYVVIRDMLPSGKKGNLPAFVLGFLVSLAVLSALNAFVVL